MFEQLKSTLKSEEFRTELTKVVIQTVVLVGVSMLVRAAVDAAGNAIAKQFTKEADQMLEVAEI